MFLPLKKYKIIINYDVMLVKAVAFMKEKRTDDLKQELMSVPSLEKYLSENRDSFKVESTAAMLSRLIDERKIAKSTVARESGMSEIYLYQILSGRRSPSRNRLICLCFGLSVGVDGAQELLRLSGAAQLYPRIRRDAIIIYGLSHGMSLFDVNDRLFEQNEETLF